MCEGLPLPWQTFTVYKRSIRPRLPCGIICGKSSNAQLLLGSIGISPLPGSLPAAQTEVSLSPASVIAATGSNPAFMRISFIAHPILESSRACENGLGLLTPIQGMYLMNVYSVLKVHIRGVYPLTYELGTFCPNWAEKFLIFLNFFSGTKKPADFSASLSSFYWFIYALEWAIELQFISASVDR